MEPKHSDSPSPENTPLTPPPTTTSSPPPEPEVTGPSLADWVELGVKIAGPLLTVLGIYVGVWKYQDEQAHNDSLEFERKLWERRLETYTQVGDLSARLIGNTSNKSRFDSLSRRFDELYWSRLPLIDDDAVGDSLKVFHDQVDDIRHAEGDSVVLRVKAYALMKTCQQSLRATWHRLHDD